VAELARGSTADRPWGRTFATLGLRGVTGQLTVAAEGRRFLVVFDQGAVSQSGMYLHELMHDGRHLLGVPCH
jgi:hypothetical protein